MPIVIYDYSSIFNKKNKLFEYGKFHLFLPFKNFVEHIQWSLPCAEGGGGVVVFSGIYMLQAML